MSENDFWNEMRNSIGHSGHFSRVESPQTSAGIPDVDFCVEGIEGHIELKFGEGGNAPRMRPSQVKWFNSRVKAGGKPIIFAKLVDGADVRYCFYHGDKARQLYDAKAVFDWVDLSDYAYVAPHWDVFLHKIKAMCKEEPRGH